MPYQRGGCTEAHTNRGTARLIETAAATRTSLEIVEDSQQSPVLSFFFGNASIFYCVLCIIAKRFAVKIQLVEQHMPILMLFIKVSELEVLTTLILDTSAGEQIVKPMVLCILP